MRVLKNIVEDGETSFHFAEQLLKLVDEFEVDVESELCNSINCAFGVCSIHEHRGEAVLRNT